MLRRFLGYLNVKISSVGFDTFLPDFEEDFGCERVYMLAQLSGNEVDWQGRRRKDKINLGNTFSWNRFFKKPLVTEPKNLAEIDVFLKSCEYLSDMETRGCQDYWEPPDIFEERKTGDCEDHAIWAWRHLHTLGYKTRLVLGDCKGGHAWVHIYVNDRVYILEATQKVNVLPLVKYYTPYWSVQRMTSKKFATYEHSPPKTFLDGPMINPEEMSDE